MDSTIRVNVYEDRHNKEIVQFIGKLSEKAMGTRYRYLGQKEMSLFIDCAFADCEFKDTPEERKKRLGDFIDLATQCFEAGVKIPTAWYEAMGKLASEETVKKPPVGIRPKFIWMQERVIALDDAIYRYTKAGLEYPYVWLEEKNELLKEISKIQRGSGCF